MTGTHNTALLASVAGRVARHRAHIQTLCSEQPYPDTLLTDVRRDLEQIDREYAVADATLDRTSH